MSIVNVFSHFSDCVDFEATYTFGVNNPTSSKHDGKDSVEIISPTFSEAGGESMAEPVMFEQYHHHRCNNWATEVDGDSNGSF